MPEVHVPTTPQRCVQWWGRGRWFGALHMCKLHPYHEGRCLCTCGAMRTEAGASYSTADNESSRDERADGTG